MAHLCEISQLGSDVLRCVAKEVEDVTSRETQTLIDDLIFTCKANQGLGIAAPQVGHSQAIMIIASEPNERYPHAPLMPPTAFINPQLLSHSNEVEKEWEGCLSLPGIRALVPRYTWIDVSYMDSNGAFHTERFEGFLARIFQHEYDHLIGHVFIDRIESSMDVVMEKEYQRLRSLG